MLAGMEPLATSPPSFNQPSSLQLMGMSNAAASSLVATYLLGGGLGGLLGGWIGDRAAGRWPDHGRISATQFSVIVGVPFALLLFRVGV